MMSSIVHRWDGSMHNSPRRRSTRSIGSVKNEVRTKHVVSKLTPWVIIKEFTADVAAEFWTIDCWFVPGRI